MSAPPPPRHLPGLESAHAIETDALLLSERSLADILAASAMGAFVGRAGTGKSFALATLVAALEGLRVLWMEFESRPTMLHIARVLASTLGIEPRGNRHQLSPAIVDALRPIRGAPQTLVVVDEAQRLNRECIEYLRYLHDHAETGFALALLGGNGCWEVIRREPMLRSRIFRRVTFRPMGLATLLQVLPEYHEIYRECDEQLISEVDGRCCRGVFRDWAAFTATAVTLAAERSERSLNREIAELAMKLLPGNEDAT